MIGTIAFICILMIVGVAIGESKSGKLRRGGGILPTTNNETQPREIVVPQVRKRKLSDLKSPV
jgi:hypothetical protein